MISELPRIGVLGGMGPLASAEFMVKLVQATPAQFDQDHFPTILDASPQIPDRPSALAGKGPDPLPAMIQVIRRLEQTGCALITMPCNTVHYWHGSLQAHTVLPILHIADAVAEMIRSEFPNARRIGLLGSTVTSDLGIFSNRLGDEWQWMYATANELSTLVMPAIAAVKAGDLVLGRSLFLTASQQLVSRAPDVLVYACTEIPIVLTAADVSVPTIDSMHALAVYTIRHAQQMMPRIDVAQAQLQAQTTISNVHHR